MAAPLRVSREARDLLAAADVVDLHVESFIWTRVAGYDLGRRHGGTWTGQRLWGQADVPRMRDGGLTGAVMSIATNPFRRHAGRRRVCAANVARLQRDLARAGTDVVADVAGYERARAVGRLACFVALQGGNAVGPDDLADPALATVSRVTLVHLTRSRLGSPSAPGGGDGGLTAEGRRYVEALAERRIVLDLAHAGPRTFADTLAVHGRATPVVASHTGVRACRDVWRNLDDDQIRAVADTGGVVGVIAHRGFLTEPGRRATVDDVVAHLAHVVAVGGEGAAAVGSDFDGFILPPRGFRGVADVPVLVQAMLDARFPPDRIVRILGQNALRAMAAVRPTR